MRLLALAPKLALVPMLQVPVRLPAQVQERVPALPLPAQVQERVPALPLLALAPML
ncbi:MAG: hypothetical protein IT491_08605, partial [Gammaproteobacteria bacterium]|nr:hypothetical protein [Gammaproteobacteria bacterium]